MEQFSISVRYIDVSTFAVHDAFLGLYNPNSSSADALTAAIVDVMLRLNIPLTKLRGHSFDGASNISGRLKGVQAQLTAMSLNPSMSTVFVTRLIWHFRKQQAKCR